jgi:hypothetical protein
MIALVLIVATIALGPVTVFARRLRAVYLESSSRYAVLVERFIRRFDRKWTGPTAPRDDDALAELDAQNMADLANVFDRILTMRFVPFEPVVVHDLAIGIGVPLLPFLLASMSLQEVLKRMVQAVL